MNVTSKAHILSEYFSQLNRVFCSVQHRVVSLEKLNHIRSAGYFVPECQISVSGVAEIRDERHDENPERVFLRE